HQLQAHHHHDDDLLGQRAVQPDAEECCRDEQNRLERHRPTPPTCGSDGGPRRSSPIRSYRVRCAASTMPATMVATITGLTTAMTSIFDPISSSPSARVTSAA